ncbi:MAG: energy transducer TonB [Saprospiraceae bacterium]|nr:energy transducer TonB [Saprospiraceae bacterium]
MNDKKWRVGEVPLRFKFINVDYLDQNVMFVDPHVYKIISDMPHPNSTFLNMNIKVTDAIRQIEASEEYEKCTTVISFTILEDGRCINWEIHKSSCWDIAEDILEEFKKTSPWKPGTQLGRRVKCRYVIPYKFRK